MPKQRSPLRKKQRSSRPQNREYVHDHYTQQAFQKGYQARSVCKLSEIDRQYKLLRPGMRVLDLGAAPGSWSRYVLQRIRAPKVPRHSENTEEIRDGAWLCAVDLHELQGFDKELREPSALSFFQADFRSTELQRQILICLERDGLFNLLLSDMAPHTTGNRTVDTGRSETLAEEILAVLPRFLQPGGSLLFKLFLGGGEQQIERKLRGLFATCRRLKPVAVRHQSCELYFLCRGYQS